MTILAHTKTQEEYDRLMEALEEAGKRILINAWLYKENHVVRIEDKGAIGYLDIKYYAEYYLDIPILSTDTAINMIKYPHGSEWQYLDIRVRIVGYYKDSEYVVIEKADRTEYAVIYSNSDTRIYFPEEIRYGMYYGLVSPDDLKPIPMETKITTTDSTINILGTMKTNTSGEWQTYDSTQSGLFTDKTFLEALEKIRAHTSDTPCYWGPGIQKLFNNSLTQKPMNKVTKFIKNLTLSKREKLFREEGLKNDCGEYTEAYDDIALHLLFQDMEERVEEYVNQMKEEEKKDKKEK